MIAVGSGVDLGTPIELATNASRFSLASERGGAVVVWRELDDRQSCAHARRLSSDGNFKGASISLGCGSTATAPPVVVTGGDVPLIVWSDPKAIVGVTLGPRAARPAFRISHEYTSDVVAGWDGERYWVGFANGKELSVQRLTRAGLPDGAVERMSNRWQHQPAQISAVALPCAANACTLLYSAAPSVGTVASGRYGWRLQRGTIGKWTDYSTNTAAQSPWVLELPIFARVPRSPVSRWRRGTRSIAPAP